MHLLARMRGLRAGHLILLGFLLHSGFNFPFLLSNEFFLMKDVHVHFSRLGRSNPKPPISLSWGGKRNISEVIFASYTCPAAATGAPQLLLLEATNIQIDTYSYVSTHSFIQQTFTQLYTRYCAKCSTRGKASAYVELRSG